MTIIIGDVIGAEILRLSPSPGNSPELHGQTNSQDVGFLWDVVGSDLRVLPPQDRELVESMWMGAVQSASDLLSDVMFYDSQSSALEAKLLRPRRWVHYDLRKSVDMGTETELDTFLPPSADFGIEYAGADRPENLYSFAQGSSPGYVGKSFRGRFRLHSSVEVETSVEFSSDETSSGAWVVVGYFGEEYGSEGFGLGVNSLGQVAIFTALDGSTTKHATSLEYSTGPVRLEWEVDSAGAVQATVLYGSESHSISLSPEYSQIEVSSLKVFPLSSSLAEDVPVSRGAFSVKVGETKFCDLSLPPNVRSVPVLQALPYEDSSLYVYGMDYLLETCSEGNRYLRIWEPYPDTVWAESVGLETYQYWSRYAPLTGVQEYIPKDSTESNRNLIVSLLYGLNQGPQVGPLSAAVSALCGAPVAVRPGEVVSFYDNAGHPAIVVQEATRRRTYYYEEGLSPSVSLGDPVSAYLVLTEGASLLTWDTAPKDVVEYVENHLVEYFQALLVEIPSGSRDLSSTLLDAIRAYLDRAVAPWVGATKTLFRIFHGLEDRMYLSDLFKGETYVNVYDAYTGQAPTLYGSSEPITYGAGDTEYNQDDLYVLQDLIGLNITNLGAIPSAWSALGESGTAGPGDTVLITEVAPDFEVEVSSSVPDHSFLEDDLAGIFLPDDTPMDP